MISITIHILLVCTHFNKFNIILYEVVFFYSFLLINTFVAIVNWNNGIKVRIKLSRSIYCCNSCVISTHHLTTGKYKKRWQNVTKCFNCKCFKQTTYCCRHCFIHNNVPPNELCNRANRSTSIPTYVSLLNYIEKVIMGVRYIPASLLYLLF